MLLVTCFLNASLFSASVKGIYSRGPSAHLLHGVVEQNNIFHIMDYALCLSDSKKEVCKKQNSLPLVGGAESHVLGNRLMWLPSLLALVWFLNL